MKEELRKIAEEMIAARWPDQYALLDIIDHQYGFSLIFMNKKINNRFSPTIIPTQLAHNLLIKNSPTARRTFESELETAFAKERISG